MYSSSLSPPLAPRPPAPPIYVYIGYSAEGGAVEGGCSGWV